MKGSVSSSCADGRERGSFTRQRATNLLNRSLATGAMTPGGSTYDLRDGGASRMVLISTWNGGSLAYGA